MRAFIMQGNFWWWLRLWYAIGRGRWSLWIYDNLPWHLVTPRHTRGIQIPHAFHPPVPVAVEYVRHYFLSKQYFPGPTPTPQQPCSTYGTNGTKRTSPCRVWSAYGTVWKLCGVTFILLQIAIRYIYLTNSNQLPYFAPIFASFNRLPLVSMQHHGITL